MVYDDESRTKPVDGFFVSKAILDAERLMPCLLVEDECDARVRTHFSALRFGFHPSRQLRTRQRPSEQATPFDARIVVQSMPSDVEAQPPQESRAFRVSTHSSMEKTSVSIGREGRDKEQKTHILPNPPLLRLLLPSSACGA